MHNRIAFANLWIFNQPSSLKFFRLFKFACKLREQIDDGADADIDADVVADNVVVAIGQ